MRTELLESHKSSTEGIEADRILRNCVHCGFCTATCPTYQLLGDELDGPRGRIYLIKQALEGHAVTEKTQMHLDRCLTCRACETTCPSGVEYGRLVDIGRAVVDRSVSRPPLERLIRFGLRKIIANPKLFRSLLTGARLASPLLPQTLRQKIPKKQTPLSVPTATHSRFVVLLDGCAQSVATPNTNAAAARILDKLGVEAVAAPQAGCCGALSHHLNAATEAQNQMRRNIDAWWPLLEKGAEAIVMTASGCGVVVKEYGHLLAHDTAYRDKAARISSATVDVSEYLSKQKLPSRSPPSTSIKAAFHSPCTLQHGQQISGLVEALLTNAGYSLVPVSDPHLCCGSAGTYSVLQPTLSQQLLTNKVSALQAGSPDVIATANVGCQLHLATGAGVPVRHWLELLAESAESP